MPLSYEPLRVTAPAIGVFRCSRSVECGGSSDRSAFGVRVRAVLDVAAEGLQLRLCTRIVQQLRQVRKTARQCTQPLSLGRPSSCPGRRLRTLLLW